MEEKRVESDFMQSEAATHTRAVRVPRSLKTVGLLLLGIGGLLAGLWAGLLRLGWQMPGGGSLAALHGPLMVSGFLGTLVALERAAAIRRGWMFLAPALTGLGWVLSLALASTGLGPLLITAGSLGTCAILAFMVRREPRIHTITMGVGALAWLVGNGLWLAGLPIFRVVVWWQAFLVLTVAGERLELSRVLRPKRAQKRLFTGAAGLFLLGAALSLAFADWGARLAGVGMLALAVWLVRFDLARRNLRHRVALTRFIALCLFAGYLWLGLGGALQVIFGAQVGGAYYDAQLHAVFLGFIFSMIFGHAPIIFPALLNLPVKFRRSAYSYLALLHASLVVRVAGDLLGLPGARRWGGLFNEVALTLFLVMTLGTVAIAKLRGARGK